MKLRLLHSVSGSAALACCVVCWSTPVHAHGNNPGSTADEGSNGGDAPPSMPPPTFGGGQWSVLGSVTGTVNARQLTPYSPPTQALGGPVTGPGGLFDSIVNQGFDQLAPQIEPDVSTALPTDALDPVLSEFNFRSGGSSGGLAGGLAGGVIPAPGTLALVGLAALVAGRRRRRLRPS